MADSIILLAKLDTNSALSGGGKTELGLNRRPNSRLETQTNQAGTGEDDGVKLATIKLGESGIHIAAQKTNLQIRAMTAQLATAA